MVQTQTIGWNEARKDAEPIRYTVFVDEQKVPVEMELDEHDPVSVHVIARSEGKAVGTGRLLPDGHIGRMAVLKEWRGKDVGSEMLKALMDVARRRGDKEVVLSAQTHALEFYRKHGFVSEGPVYPDCDIPHQDMRRTL